MCDCTENYLFAFIVKDLNLFIIKSLNVSNTDRTVKDYDSEEERDLFSKTSFSSNVKITILFIRDYSVIFFSTRQLSRLEVKVNLNFKLNDFNYR